jgi:hypothetical protein
VSQALRAGWLLGVADWAVEHDPLALLCARVLVEQFEALQ